MRAAVARRPIIPSLESAYLPAPTRGLHTVGKAPQGAALQLYNMVAGEYGLRTRLGSREWCTGLTGAADNQVRSIIPFTGSAKNGTNDKLFATTSSGIWNVTASSSSPTLVHSFSTTSGEAGYGVSCVVVTSAGHFLLYCDEENGFLIYTESSGLWAGGSITGVTAANLAFVTFFKSRVWFVEKNTANAWYFDTANGISGAATAFRMGGKFRAGGHLVGLYNWTYDGGAGIDDSLVAVSSGGDVLVWQLNDPTTPAGTLLKGVWYAPGVPYGRKIATNFGGDVLLLTRVGIIPMSKLVVGASEDVQQYSTYAIGPLFNQLMLTRASYKQWSMRVHPEDNALIVTVPEGDGLATNQLAMAMSNQSWSRYRDLPIYSSEVWGGKLYFGTTNGKVLINDGAVDGVTLADPNAYTGIQWHVLTAFDTLGNGRQKRVQMVKPYFLGESAQPAWYAEPRYDYDLTELATVSPTVPGSGSWDSGQWDSGIWGGEYTPTTGFMGGVGVGCAVAIAIRGSATARTVLEGMDVYFQQGGFR